MSGDESGYLILRLTQTSLGEDRYRVEIATEGDGKPRLTASSDFTFKMEAGDQRSAVDELVAQIKDIRTAVAHYPVEEHVTRIRNILGKQTFETQKIVSKARLNAGRKQGDVR